MMTMVKRLCDYNGSQWWHYESLMSKVRMTTREQPRHHYDGGTTTA